MIQYKSKIGDHTYIALKNSFLNSTYALSNIVFFVQNGTPLILITKILIYNKSKMTVTNGLFSKNDTFSLAWTLPLTAFHVSSQEMDKAKKWLWALIWIILVERNSKTDTFVEKWIWIQEYF